MTTPARLCATAIAASLMFAAPAVSMADDVAAAARAYSNAQTAELAGKHARAAVLYELADRSANAPEALRGAARSRFAAGDHAVAATHALELVRRYPNDSASRKLAERILARISSRLARVDVRCGEPCTVTIDGAAVGLDPQDQHSFYANPGASELAARFANGQRRARSVDLTAGKAVSLTLTPPPTAPDPEPTPSPALPPPPTDRASAASSSHRTGAETGAQVDTARSGLSKLWFVGGAVVTVGLAGAATWSGLDVLEANHQYEDDPTEAGYQDGLRRQRRTNILIGAAAASAAATITVAFFTRWSGSERRPQPARLVLTPTRGGGAVAVGGTF